MLMNTGKLRRHMKKAHRLYVSRSSHAPLSPDAQARLHQMQAESAIRLAALHDAINNLTERNTS